MGRKQINIAVQISGLIRYWDATYPLFEYWNSLFEDVKFTFFVSTWSSQNIWYNKLKHDSSIIDSPNLSEYRFITAWSKHNQSDVKVPFSGAESNSCYFSYLFKKVTELRNRYEKETNTIFDGVIQTRNDIFISKDLLESTCAVIREEEYFYNKETIFCSGPLQLLGSPGKKYLMLGDDNFCFGHPKCIDDYSKLYDIKIAQESYEHQDIHFIRGEHLYKTGKTVVGITEPIFIFREKEVATKNQPSPYKMLDLIKDGQVEWIFKQYPTELMNQIDYYED